MKNSVPETYDDFGANVQLLLELVQFSTPSQKIVQQYTSSVDFKEGEFLKIVVKTHLAGFVYHQLSPFLHLFSTQFGQVLLQYHLQTLKQEALIDDTFEKLISILNAAGITEIYPLKGVRIAAENYPAAGTREISDIDILCKKEMGSTIIQNLKDADYTICPHVYKSKAHERYDTFHAPYTITSQTGVVIDVHFFLFPKKFELTIDQDKMLAAASQRTTKNGNSYAYFTEIDHFLYVCLHAYKHLWRDEFKFSSFADMKLLLTQQLQDVSRSTIQERANELGCLDPAMRMLDLFCRLFPKSLTNEAPPIVDKHQLLLWKKVCSDLNQYTLTKKDKRQRFTYRRFNLSKSTLLQPQLLFYELFPSPSYLRTYFPGRNYITRWFKRII